MKRFALGVGVLLLLAAGGLAVYGVPAPPAMSSSDGARVQWSTTISLARLAARHYTDDFIRTGGWMRNGEGILVFTGITGEPGIIRAPGEEVERIPGLPDRARPLRFRPDVRDESFAYALDEGGSERRILHWYDAETDESTALTDTPARMGLCCWDPAGERLAFTSTERNGADRDLYLWQVGEQPERVYEGDGTLYPLRWSPDGRSIVLLRSHSFSSRVLHRFDVETRRLERLLPEWGDDVVLSGPHFDDDGRHLYFTSDHNREFRSIWRLELETGAVTPITGELGSDVVGFEPTPDGQRMVLLVNEDGIHRLYTMDPGTGVLDPVPGGPEHISTFDVHDTRKLVFALSFPEIDLPEIHVFDLDAGEWTQWTAGGGFASLPEGRSIRYPTFDSVDGAPRTIQAFVFPGAAVAAGPRPVLIELHGGPASQSKKVTWPPLTVLRQRGITVVAPNVRGSTGYGRTFASLDDGYLREDAVRDVGALLQWIGEQPELDGTRVAVSGASAGGYLALASLIHYPERFACGVDRVGISDIVAFLEQSGDFAIDVQRAEWGDERDPRMRAFLDSISPARRAHEIRAPLLIYQGANDSRVKAEQSRAMVERIREAGGRVWYQEAANEGHQVQDPLNTVYTSSALVDFVTACLEPARETTAGSPRTPSSMDVLPIAKFGWPLSS